MKDLVDTLTFHAAPDERTCRALAGYLRHQADRLETHAARLAVSRGMVAAVRRNIRKPRPRSKNVIKKSALRARNREIVKLARRGWTNREIADHFKLSVNYIGAIIREAFAVEPGPVLDMQRRRRPAKVKINSAKSENRG